LPHNLKPITQRIDASSLQTTYYMFYSIPLPQSANVHLAPLCLAATWREKYIRIVTVRLFHGIIVLIGFSLYVSTVRKIFVIVHVFSYELLEEHITK
jgi:hypothetical protein